MNKTRKREMPLQHVDARVFVCLGMKVDSTPGQIELIIEASIAKMEAGSTIFWLNQLQLDEAEKTACVERLARLPEIPKEWLIEITS